VKKVSEGSFWDHLEELRHRLLIVVGSVSVLTAACFALSRRLLDFVLATGPGHLQTLAPYEAFTASLRISLTAGLVLSSPVVLWHFWRFVSPGLYPREKQAAVWAFWVSILLFLSGAAFSFFVLLKPTLLLFRSFETGGITGNWTLSNYIAFLGQFVLMFGISFELPLVILFLVWIGVFTPEQLGRYRRHVIVGLLILGAVLPPNDPLTQVLLAAPLYVLYEMSLLVARIIRRKAQVREEE
jgi:sec-independent protein translocase protein TatC